jgi:hypothetical protein
MRYATRADRREAPAWTFAVFVVLFTIAWRLLELDARWLSVVITAIGLIATTLGAAPLLAWLIALLQFHPATYSPIADVVSIAIVPFDLALLFLVIRVGVSGVANNGNGRAMMNRARRLRTPLMLLAGFVLWASLSLLLARELFTAETLVKMWITFLKLLQWPALFLLLFLILRPREELAKGLLCLVAGLGAAQAAYAVVATTLRMYLLIDITPAALNLPAEVGNLPIYLGWGPFERLFESRATSLIGGPPPTAMLAAVGGLLSVYLLGRASSSSTRMAWSCAVVICFAAAILTMTRTSWLALAVAVPVLLLVGTRKERLARLGLAAAALLVVLPAYPIISGRALDVVDPDGLAVTSRLVQGEPRVSHAPTLVPAATLPPAASEATVLRTERPALNAETGEVVSSPHTAEALGERSTLNLRLGTWLLGLHYISQRPVFGYGWSATGYLVDDAFLGVLFPTLSRDYFLSNAGSMHNIYLDLAVGTGLIGLTLFSAFVLSVFVAMLKSLWHREVEDRLLAMSLSACFIYLAVAGLGDSWLSAGNPTGWILWLLIAVASIVGVGAFNSKDTMGEPRRT